MTKTVLEPKTQSERKSSDRRVTRTRRALQAALHSLILERGYEALTVQDILDRANVGRSTFYAHYWDKQDLFISGFDDLHQVLAAHRVASFTNPKENVMYTLFEHVKNYRHLYDVTVGQESGTLVEAQMQSSLASFWREQLASELARAETRGLPGELVVQFLVSSFLALVKWWLESNSSHSASEMNRMFNELAMPTMTSLFQREA